MLYNALLNLGILAAVSAALVLAPSPLLNPPSVPFGVRVPPDKADAPEVAVQRRRYRNLFLGASAGVAVFALAAGAAFDSLAAGAVCAVGGSVLLTVASAVLWVRAHRAVARAKEQGGWYEQTRQGAFTDTSLRTDPVRFPWAWAIPAFVIVAVTAVVGAVVYPDLPDHMALPQKSPSGTVYREYATTVWTAFALVLTQIAVTATMAGSVAGLLRARADLDVSRPRTSATRYRRYLAAMSRSVLGMAALIDLMLFGLAGMMWADNRSQAVIGLVVGVPLLAVLGMVAHLVLRVGPGGSRLPDTVAEPDSGLVPRDDDRFWHGGGLIYVNTDDPAIMVARRVGLGWTVNLGNLRFLVLLAVFVALAAGAGVVAAVAM
ncbi:DUF1648 domain-containing protein [Streptomyces sp. NPDC056347]|uniref:DUF1648 domain-containing protein n=1 Tax=Streptomyces sp. NPDC056347 TaxID=3345790 RepID=UPI0035D5EABB